MEKHVLDLPPEILQKIFMFLPRSDLYNLRTSCKNFKTAASVPQVLQVDLSKRHLSIEDLERNPHLNSMLPNVTMLNLFGNLLPAGDHDSEASLPSGSITPEVIEKVKEACVHLRFLQIYNYHLDDGISLERFPPGLAHLSLNCIFGLNSDALFGPKIGPALRNLEKLSMLRCGPLTTSAVTNIATLQNLRCLSLAEVRNLGDEQFACLDGHLRHLEELEIVDAKIGDRSLEVVGRSFHALRKFSICKCRVRDDGFVAIKNNHRLEELNVHACPITDRSARQVLGSLVHLRVLKLSDCFVGNDTMLAICQSLPNLTELKIIPKEQSSITDDGIANVVMHQRLVDLQLINVLLTDDGMKRLAPCVPNLEKLYVCLGGIGDDGLLAIAENLPRLRQLILNESLISDAGLKHIVGRLCHLEQLEIDSIHLSEEGVRPIVDFLQPLRTVDLTFNASGSGIHVHGQAPTREIDFKGRMLSVDFVRQLWRLFPGAVLVNLTAIELSPSDAVCLAEHCPDVESIYIYDSMTNDEVVSTLLERCKAIKSFHVYNTVLSDAMVLEVAETYAARLSKLSIESETFVETATVVKVAPHVAGLQWFELCSTDLKNRLIVERVPSEKLSVTGPRFDDDALVALVASFGGRLDALSICDTSVTCSGLGRIAPSIEASLAAFEFTCENVPDANGDEVVSFICGSFPSKLRELSLKGGAVTDQGLARVCDAFVHLNKLEVCNALVTDVAIRNAAAKLQSCRTLVFSNNVNVTDDVHVYMAANFPDIVFVLHEEDDDQEDDEM